MRGQSARPGKLAPGTVLEGKYQIVREIGRGAMGVVYEAVHVALGRKVAVKTLLEEVRADAQMGERFQREARAASAIGHPNIVDVFDLGRTQDGVLFMVMELLAGRSLGDILKETPKLPIPLAVHVMVQTLSGLSAAHKHGIIHRDLKPDNLFVLDSEERPQGVKIVDFGISKVLAPRHPAIAANTKGTGTMVGSILGTPLYMSPEQAIGQITAIDHRTDIYSAGVVLYEMLCGRTPFVGEGYAQILGALIEGKYPPPRSLRPDISADLEDAITCALDRDMNRRFSSAAAMRTAISEGLAEVTPAPVVLASVFAEPGPGEASTSPPPSTSIVLASEATPSTRRSPEHDPFAPPPDSEQVPLLVDDADHPRALRKGGAGIPTDSHERDEEPRAVPVDDPTDAGEVERPRGASRREGSSARTGIVVASLLLVAALGARLGYGTLYGDKRPAPAGSGKKHALRLLVEPSQATVQVDHVPTPARELLLEGGVPHELNVTAPGRLTRRFAFKSDADASLTVHLARQVLLPAPTDPPALAPELAIEYPDEPQATADIERALDKLDRYADCLAMVGDPSGEAKKGDPRGRLRKEELALCQQTVAAASAGEPSLPELQAAAESFLAASQQGQKAEGLARLATTFRAEFLAARSTWQMEELSRLGKDEGQKLLWHMRRVALAGYAWLRSLRTPVEERRGERLREDVQALAELVQAGGSTRAAGASDFLQASQTVASLSRDRKTTAFAALAACRQLIAAFNALVDDSPGPTSGKR